MPAAGLGVEPLDRERSSIDGRLRFEGDRRSRDRDRLTLQARGRARVAQRAGDGAGGGESAGEVDRRRRRADQRGDVAQPHEVAPRELVGATQSTFRAHSARGREDAGA